MDLANREELQTNLDCVRDYARERNVHEPRIFAVSALREEAGAADSGFSEFRKFIARTVETGEVWRIKFEGGARAAAQVAGEAARGLEGELAAAEGDAEFIEGLTRTLTSRHDKAAGLQKLVVQSLTGTYSSLTNELTAEFESGLRIGTILRRSLPLVRDKTVSQWLEELRRDFEAKAARRIDEDAAKASAQLSAEVDGAIDELTSSIDHHKLARREPLRVMPVAMASPLDELRNNLDKSRLAGFLAEGLPRHASFSGELLTAGGVLALGVLVAAVTKVAVFDVTGGILAGLGIALVAGILFWKRGAILADLRGKIADGRRRFQEELERSFGGLFDRLFHEIEHNIRFAQDKAADRVATIRPLADRARRIQKDAESLGRE